MANLLWTRTFTTAQARFGTWLFAAGVSVLVIAAWDNSGAGLPWPMPGVWHRSRDFCLLIALIAFVVGLFVMSRGPREADVAEDRFRAWQPSRSGLRFRSVILYTRDGCHLCDDAAELLQSYSAFLPPIQEIDIDGDSTLRDRWDSWVPVVEIDGRVRFKGRISEMLLRRMIEGTPPA